MKPERRIPKSCSAQKAQANMAAFIDRVVQAIEASGTDRLTVPGRAQKRRLLSQEID
jgi:hypothetical protein